MFALFGAAVLRSRVQAARWLFAAGMLVAILSFCGAINGRLNLVAAEFGQRHAVVPTMLLTLGLAALASVARWRRDPARPLQIWPDGWTISLPRRAPAPRPAIILRARGPAAPAAGPAKGI